MMFRYFLDFEFIVDLSCSFMYSGRSFEDILFLREVVIKSYTIGIEMFLYWLFVV